MYSLDEVSFDSCEQKAKGVVDANASRGALLEIRERQALVCNLRF